LASWYASFQNSGSQNSGKLRLAAFLFFTPAAVFEISRYWKLANAQVWAFQKRLLGAIFILFKIKYLQKSTQRCCYLRQHYVRTTTLRLEPRVG